MFSPPTSKKLFVKLANGKKLLIRNPTPQQQVQPSSVKADSSVPETPALPPTPTGFKGINYQRIRHRK